MKYKVIDKDYINKIFIENNPTIKYVEFNSKEEALQYINSDINSDINSSDFKNSLYE